MGLGDSLSSARKSRGLSQEEAAEKLGVSRQTVSKWETDETLPDIRQAKKLAALYLMPLDALFDFDPELEAIRRVIGGTSEEVNKKVDWAREWGKKYPILNTYRQEVRVDDYAGPLGELLERLRREYGYSELDAFLVLKDILGGLWSGKQ